MADNNTVQEDEEMDEQSTDEMPESLVSYFEAWKKRGEKLVLQDMEAEGGENLPPVEPRTLGCSQGDQEARRSQVVLQMIEEVQQLTGSEMIYEDIQDDLKQDFSQKQELIKGLQSQVEEVRRALEEAQEQQRRREEVLRRDAATVLQAATRGLLVRRWACKELLRRREEQRRTRERQEREEKRRKREEEREVRKQIRRQKKEQEEEEKRKREEEEIRKIEEVKRKEEEKMREKEEERRRREEEERKREIEERRMKEEEKMKMEKVEKEKRMKEEEERREQEEEEVWKVEEEKRKREEEEQRRREEEEIRQMKEERRKREEEKRKREDEERIAREEEEGERRRREEERQRAERRKKLEEEWRMDEDEEENEGELERIKQGESAGGGRDGPWGSQRKAEEKKEEEQHEQEAGQRVGSDAPADRGSGPRPDPPQTPQALQPGGGSTQTPASPAPSHHTPAADTATTAGGATATPRQPPDWNAGAGRAADAEPRHPDSLPHPAEQKRLAWMRACTTWSALALQNSSRPRGSARGTRGPGRRVSEETNSHMLSPLRPEMLLQPGNWKTLQEVITVTLEDVPGLDLSTLAQCGRLRALTLRRCGLRALEGLAACSQLCYVDVQENDITFVDCEKMTKLRVLRLGHNQLTCVHGLDGAVNLDVLELSYNFITRIAGLECLNSLQSLSVDHNQLVSTAGLAPARTLLRLDCSHNHLTQLEGLESCVLLGTLDARANSLTEPPRLGDQVLLRELHLDHNSLSSLQGLSDYWLPLLQELSASHNSITQLPPMSDFVSLVSLDVGHNCLSELSNACETLGACLALREVHLPGNPLEAESGWRDTLQAAVPGLRSIIGQQTTASPSPPADRDCAPPAGSFVALCRVQLQETQVLWQRQDRWLSGAPRDLGSLLMACQGYTEALRLAQEDRRAHQYGRTALPGGPRDGGEAERLTTPTCGDAAEESGGRGRPSREQPETRDAPLNASIANVIASSSPEPPSTGKGGASRSSSSSAAAVVIQRHWRRRSRSRRGRGRVLAPPPADRGDGSQNGSRSQNGGCGGDDSSGPCQTGQDHAATVIQALWRGRALRKRLAAALALAAARYHDAGGDDESLAEVDVDQFNFDEAVLDTDLSGFSSDGSSGKPHQQLFGDKMYQEPPEPPATWNPRQAWVAEVLVPEESPEGRIALPVSASRTKCAASALLSGLSQRSEKILEEWGFRDSNTALLMLKRARKMNARTQKHKPQAENPSGSISVFKTRTDQLGPPGEPKRTAAHLGGYLKGTGWGAFRGLPQAGRAEQERVKEERTSQWLHSQASHSDHHLHYVRSERFLPDIDGDVLSGGRVQLVAGNGHKKDPDPVAGCRANSSASQPREERRNSWAHAKTEAPAHARVLSSLSKKERVSFRDNPVQMSGGWGAGKTKKRDKVCK